jgi:DNA invertase Pin-like site-specific DNA recombinase
MVKMRGVGFRSLQENIDTTTSGGKLILHVFEALAEFERDIIRERTNAGLAAVAETGVGWAPDNGFTGIMSMDQALKVIRR